MYKSLHNKTIWLAEGNHEDEQLILLALRKANFECHVEMMRDGEAMLDRLFELEKLVGDAVQRLPDLVLLSLDLPKLDGIKVLKMLRNTHREDLVRLPPLVVFTRSDDERDVSESYRCGAHGFIRKPESPGQFIEVVQQAVIYWLCVNEPPPSNGKSCEVAIGVPDAGKVEASLAW
jgi:two-component system response regulator